MISGDAEGGRNIDGFRQEPLEVFPEVFLFVSDILRYFRFLTEDAEFIIIKQTLVLPAVTCGDLRQADGQSDSERKGFHERRGP